MPRTCVPRPRGAAAVSFALAGSLLAGAAHGQGDTGLPVGEGRSFVGASYAWDVAADYRIGGSSTSLDGDLVRRTATVSYAYGFTDRVDAWAAGSYAWSELEGQSTVPDESGLSDLAFGVRWHAWQDRWGAGRLGLTLAPAMKIPLGDYETGTVTALGDGQTDVRLRAVGSWRGHRGVVLAIESGYDVRFGDPDDEVPLNLTAGLSLTERVHVSAFYSRVDSLGGESLAGLGGPLAAGAGSGAGGTPDLVEVEEDVETTGLGVYVALDGGLGVAAGWRTTIGGSNTPEYDGFVVSLVRGP